MSANRAEQSTTHSNSADSNDTAADRLTQRNVELMKQLEVSAREGRKNSDRIAEAIANFCGSMTFVWVYVTWFGIWIIFNSIPGLPKVDPFPFTFLTLVVSLEAIFLSTFILISQNHDTKLSERRNNLDLQINLLSEQENTKMIRILQAIAKKVGAEDVLDEEIQLLEKETQLEEVVAQIEQRED